MRSNDLLPAFNEQLQQLCGDSPLAGLDFQIALSGGLDSVVLVHLFARLRAEIVPDLTISAHHINHGLSENAPFWEEFCSLLCTELAVDFDCSAVKLVRAKRTSLEALAREKRYRCLTQRLRANSYLVTAHHQDDQLETVLLALKRGAGNTGLQGILSKQTLSGGYLIRPLLNFSRQQLVSYAQYFGLQWIEDESNSDQVFDRNYIRHTISPLLKARWPAIGKTVARSAAICQEQQQLLDEIAQLDFARCACRQLHQHLLSIEQLQALSVARRNNVLRYWFKTNKLNYPSAKQLAAVWSDIVLAAQDASPKMHFQHVSLRRYRQHLYLVEEQAALDFNETHNWTDEERVNLLDGRVKLHFQPLTEAADGLFIPRDAEVKICFRAHLPAKLSCTPIGRSRSRSIKKLLHEYHVPPWLRDFVPFILIDGKLQQAVGLWQCQSLPAAAGQYVSISFA